MRAEIVWEKKRLDYLMGLVVLIMMALLANYHLHWSVAAESSKVQKETVVLDPGHGGMDPGKVGSGNVLEKDINLAISLCVKELLEQSNVQVVMTRQEDVGLYEETDSNKKLADMKARCALIEETNPSMVVSIHQNSYSDKSAKGAQVFYYAKSQEGKVLAQIMQDALIAGLDEKNARQPKANSDYYMLCHTVCPAVIVECGFLTNPTECSQLTETAYQRKVAEAITHGILEYMEKQQ